MSRKSPKSMHIPKTCTDNQRINFLIRKNYQVLERHNPTHGICFDVTTHDGLIISSHPSWRKAVDAALRKTIIKKIKWKKWKKWKSKQNPMQQPI